MDAGETTRRNVRHIGNRIPKIDTATWGALGLRDMRHGVLKDGDMGHGNFLKSTGRH